MKTIVVLVLFLLAASVQGAESDTRELVEFPDHMRQHMLANMRDHLAALANIQRAMGSGDFQRAADIAERSIGVSSLASHGASHMASFMPKPMQEIGAKMHQAASQFALVAQETGADGNVGRAMGSLSLVTEQCVACHAAYRAH
jgi:cytochrome c556